MIPKEHYRMLHAKMDSENARVLKILPTAMS